MSKVKKLKRAIITEELTQLCGDAYQAIILRQMLYWSVRVDEFDEYLKEVHNHERKQEEFGETIPYLQNGWIYKTAKELSDEVMISSRQTISLRLSQLIKKGYLQKRKNPRNVWDQTLQYQVNFCQLEADLNHIGYSLATVMGKDYAQVQPILESYQAMSLDEEARTEFSDLDASTSIPSPNSEATDIIVAELVLDQPSQLRETPQLEAASNQRNIKNASTIPKHNFDLKGITLSPKEEDEFFQQAVAYKLAHDSKMDQERASSIIQAMIRRIQKGQSEARDRALMAQFRSGHLKHFLHRNQPTRTSAEERYARVAANLVAEGELTPEELGY